VEEEEQSFHMDIRVIKRRLFVEICRRQIRGSEVEIRDERQGLPTTHSRPPIHRWRRLETTNFHATLAEAKGGTGEAKRGRPHQPPRTRYPVKPLGRLRLG
jgi:hypothetical protein